MSALACIFEGLKKVINEVTSDERDVCLFIDEHDSQTATADMPCLCDIVADSNNLAEAICRLAGSIKLSELVLQATMSSRIACMFTYDMHYIMICTCIHVHTQNICVCIHRYLSLCLYLCLNLYIYNHI